MVTPFPGSPHQGISVRLSTVLSIALATPGYAHVYAPGVVQLFPATQLEPDVLIVAARQPLGAPWVDVTERWLAVEVFSRSSRRYDRDFKRDAYLALGVREVWLVDIADKSVDVCRERGAGRVVRDVIRWHITELDRTVEVNLSELFAGLD